MNEMPPKWRDALRAALLTPGPPGRDWHRPSDWTIEQAVEAMEPYYERQMLPMADADAPAERVYMVPAPPEDEIEDR